MERSSPILQGGKAMRIVVVAIMFSANMLMAGSVWAQADGNGVDDCEVCTSPQIWASFDLLSWTPHMRGLDYAASEDGSALSIGSGRVHSVNYDRDTGFRGHVGVNTTTGWGVGVGYTHFGTEGVDSINRPSGTGQLFSSFSHPGGPQEADVATGSAAFDYDVLDLVATHTIVNRETISVDIFGGLRWADISQEINAHFDGRDFDDGIVNSTTDLNAFGFRFGGQSHWRMHGGWSSFGKISLAALYGQFDSHRFESNFDGAQILVDLNHDYVQPVFNIETAMGVAWTCNTWQVSGGYEFNAWTNLGDNVRFVDDIEVGSFASLSGDLLLEGFFFRVAKAW